MIHGKEQESIWKSMSERIRTVWRWECSSMLHMGMDGFEYPYPSAGTSQRRFRDWEGTWHSFILPILGFLSPKYVVRVYLVKERSQMEWGRTVIQGLWRGGCSPGSTHWSPSGKWPQIADEEKGVSPFCSLCVTINNSALILSELIIWIIYRDPVTKMGSRMIIPLAKPQGPWNISRQARERRKKWNELTWK